MKKPTVKKSTKNQLVFAGQPRSVYMPQLMTASVCFLQSTGNMLKSSNATFSNGIAQIVPWKPNLRVCKNNSNKSYFQEEAEWAWTFLRHIGLFMPRKKNGYWQLTPTAIDILNALGISGIMSIINANYGLIASLNLKYAPLPASVRFHMIIDDLEADAISKNKGNQARFRQIVLTSCKNTCVVSGVAELRAIEACHIRDIYLNGPYVADNGIILRADIHKLYDVGLLLIDGSGTITSRVGYLSNFTGKRISMPNANISAMLDEKYQRFK